MEMGEKLRQARLQLGLSQRQLCGEQITRNMLSQIEHGTATPSMATLQYLAGRLGKKVSYFLDEDAVCSPNQERMAAARAHYDAGEFSEAVACLQDYQLPDETFLREAQLLLMLSTLGWAKQLMQTNRERHAQELLQTMIIPETYCRQALVRERLLLLGKLPGQCVSGELPSLDEELILRAQEAIAGQNYTRASQFLDAAEDQQSPLWCLLRGQVALESKEYLQAVTYLHTAETLYPRQAAGFLECGYRELGDYKNAYEYACRQRI